MLFEALALAGRVLLEQRHEVAPSCRGRNRTDGLRLMRPARVPTLPAERQTEHAAGIEPASPAWKAGASCRSATRACEIESRGRESNPRVHRVAAGGLSVLATSTGERAGPGLGSPPLTRAGPLGGERRNRTSDPKVTLVFGTSSPPRGALSSSSRAAEGLNLAGRFWRPARSQIAAHSLGDRPGSIRNLRVHSATCRAATPRPP